MMKAMANSPAVLEGYLGFSLAGRGRARPQAPWARAIETAESTVYTNYRLAAHSLLGKLAGLDEKDAWPIAGATRTTPRRRSPSGSLGKLLDDRGNVTARTWPGQGSGLLRRRGRRDHRHVALNVLTNYFNVAVEPPVQLPRREASGIGLGLSGQPELVRSQRARTEERSMIGSKRTLALAMIVIAVLANPPGLLAQEGTPAFP